MSSKSATEPATPEVYCGEVALRLDCWHDYMFGQQKELNQQLAKEFEKHKLTAWKVSAADTAQRHIAGNDTLVPISVDFKHSQSPGKTEVACRDDSRQLRLTVHETVLEFFNKNTQKLKLLWYTMHARNMDPRFAVEHYYLQCRENQKWKIPTRGISIPRSYDLGGSKKHSTAKIADAATKACSVAYKCGKAAEERRDDSKKPSIIGPEKAKLILEAANTTLALCDTGLDVLETERANSAKTENILQTAAQPVAASFHECKEDFKTLRQRLVFLKGTTEPSPQAVVGLVNHMSTIRVKFSKLRRNLVPFVGTVQKKRNSEIRKRGICAGVGAVVTVYAICYLCPPVAVWGIYSWVTGAATKGVLASGGVVGAGGGLRAGFVCSNSYTAKKIADNVEENQRQVQKAIEPLFGMLGILFCKTVLQMPFEHLCGDNQITYLEKLGIKKNDINNEVFQKEKLDDAAANFIKACDELIKNVDKLASKEGKLFGEVYGE